MSGQDILSKLDELLDEVDEIVLKNVIIDVDDVDLEI
jgi:hypothetical protein